MNIGSFGDTFFMIVHTYILFLPFLIFGSTTTTTILNIWDDIWDYN